MSRHDPSPRDRNSPPGGRDCRAPREVSFDRPAPLCASDHEILRPELVVIPTQCDVQVARETSVTSLLQSAEYSAFSVRTPPYGPGDNAPTERLRDATTRTRDQTGATICPRCLGAGRHIHPFPHPCGECGGGGLAA